MARFHQLEVTEVRRTTRDAVAVSLRPLSGDFCFVEGQYLTFRHVIDGTELRRSYSICAGRGEPLQVGIKRVEGGAFSTWANSALVPGMVLEAMEPAGNFRGAEAATGHVLAFAVGSGITPVLSIVRTLLTCDPAATVTLVYANRQVNTIMFRDEIEDLKNRHMQRLSVIHLLKNDAQDLDLFTGRLDAEKCDTLFAHWIDVASVDRAYICGPEPVMLTVAEALRRHRLAPDRIRYELFAGGQPGRLPQRALAGGPAAAGTQAVVTLDGSTRSFTIRKGQSLLLAALENALDAPNACRAGVCSTCKCRVLEGEVEMIANHALEDYEVARGYVLSCQSYPVSARLVVDYDR